MKKKLFLLLLYFIGFNTITFCQDSSRFVIPGPYGGDLRIRPSYGIIPDSRYENCLKIKNLDSKRIAIAVSFPQTLTITNKNFWGAKSIDYSYSFNVENFIKTLIFSSQVQSSYNFKLFEKEDSQKLNVNFWTGNLKVENKSTLDSLAQKYDSDYLIYFKGVQSTYFPSGINYTGTQGLYGWSDVYMIYAAQSVTIFNLKTGKHLSNGYFPQESADIVPLILKSDFKDFTPEQLKIIDKMLELRLKNNLKQSFKLLELE